VRSFVVEWVFGEVTDSRELYRSPNGDVWFLARDPANGKAFVIHEANPASGGQTSRVEIGAFLKPGAEGPEHQALLRLIGSLIDVPAPSYPH
jgi:hypothetical protein